MQKNISDNVSETLAEGLNKMHADSQTKSMIELVKRQASEIDKRNQAIMDLQQSMQLQKENIEKLLEQNKYLESLVQDLKSERSKLLEEIKDLKNKSTKTRKTRAKKVIEEKDGSDTQAA